MRFSTVCLAVILLLTVVSAQSTAPCMFPRIYSDGGKEVWGTYSVSSQFANDVGVSAILKDRAVPNQPIVRALRVIPENNRAQFLERFRVTFVY